MKKHDRKRGSASVLFTCLMAGLIPVFFLLYGNASLETMKNAVEWNSQNAGRAVLSYYLPQLSSRYDVYGIWKEPSLLEWRMKQYMEDSSPFWNEGKGEGLLKARLEEIQIDSKDYSLMDPKQWQKQIQTVMELKAAMDVFERTKLSDSLKEVISLAADGMEKKESAREAAVQRSGQREESFSLEEKQDEMKKQMERLSQEGKKREEEGKRKVDSVRLSEAKTLEDEHKIRELPSRRLDEGGESLSWDMLRGDINRLGEGIQASFFTDMYALDYFGNYKDQRDGWFLCELEYILHGELSDELNFKKTKQDVFLLRTVLNLASIYRNETMKQWIGAMASAAAPVPYPVAFGMIAASVSAVEAGNDVKSLLQGKEIPALKAANQWVYGEGKLNGAEEKNPGAWELSYEDHLHILLLLRPQRTKLIRMMDLVQLNLGRELDGEFSLEECCAGFHWNIRAQLEDSTGRKNVWEWEGDSAYE